MLVVDHSTPANLILDHAHVVEQEASRLRVGKLERDDLRQAGFVGLMIAAARFDADRGPFSAYARLWVRKEMQRAVAGTEFAAVVPAEYVGRVVALRGLADDGRALDEVARRLDLSVEITMALLRTLEISPGSGHVPSPEFDVEDAAILNILGEALRQAVDALPEDERTVVLDLYGIEDGTSKSTRAVAHRLGISPSTVRNRWQRSVERLRGVLHAPSPELRSTMTTETYRRLEWPMYGYAVGVPPSWAVFPRRQGSSYGIVLI
jgi:RNA polymerase sigma factor (sigma-70 family)